MPELPPAQYADPYTDGWFSWDDPDARNPYEAQSEDWEAWDVGREMAIVFHQRPPVA